ncbi:patatin-like phospholipase family protein [Caldimonas sp. KR1-144]|uniref:patatin-like phospholipase family protein n=1 Tax=Caldimonas sp. KR1-144 TaxID=3400911 RepID=UPI003C0A3FE6
MSSSSALHIHAGPAARRHIESHGLRPADVRVVAAAAGGPKGLILNPLDQFLFGRWLGASAHPVHLVGASIGAWRMATAAMDAPMQGFARLAHDYIRQDYEIEPGRSMPSAAQVSREFERELHDFFDGQVEQVVAHPRYRLHIVTSRGRHILGREGRVRTPLGYLGAVLSNAVSRKTLGAWLERVVFSSPGDALPVDLGDLRHRRVRLDAANFRSALLASCSIPFVLKAVHDIPGAPPGAYWDGGITDYHLHWRYPSLGEGLVLYPHFQKAVVPGWLDKALKHRHRATPSLDNVVVLAPNPEWVRSLPNAKLPDRNDFRHYGPNLAARVRDWSRAVAESQRLADEFAAWLEKPDASKLQPL